MRSSEGGKYETSKFNSKKPFLPFTTVKPLVHVLSTIPLSLSPPPPSLSFPFPLPFLSLSLLFTLSLTHYLSLSLFFSHSLTCTLSPSLFMLALEYTKIPLEYLYVAPQGSLSLVFLSFYLSFFLSFFLSLKILSIRNLSPG